uniref:Uncharacterized protein n=1 Tax=Panagrolaimus sp. JU765 TaxID=591449 RepID=A0AC34RES1_9BILA
MVDLKQTFNFYDYFGFIAVGAIFALALLVISFFILNFLLVNKQDELTIFEKFGSRHNLRLGPHRLDSIKRMQERRAIIEEEERALAEEKLQKQKGTFHPNSSASKPIIPQVEIEAASNS